MIDKDRARKAERLRLKEEKEALEIKQYRQHEIDLKARLARYPWIDEEMSQRKAECCERLHIDALRRLGLPLPEYEGFATEEGGGGGDAMNEKALVELLDAIFETPSIYQAI